jgi:hypothetical protein
VVQIWPGLIVCKQVTVCPDHIWTTLFIPEFLVSLFTILFFDRWSWLWISWLLCSQIANIWQFLYINSLRTEINIQHHCDFCSLGPCHRLNSVQRNDGCLFWKIHKKVQIHALKKRQNSSEFRCSVMSLQRWFVGSYRLFWDMSHLQGSIRPRWGPYVFPKLR